jgi:hypothetical protein
MVNLIVCIIVNKFWLAGNNYVISTWKSNYLFEIP